MCLWFDLEALIFGLGNLMNGEVIEKSWKTIAKKVYKPCACVKHCVQWVAL